MSIGRLGLEVLLPKMQLERMVYGRLHTVIRPLFPGYLFARFSPSKYLHLINFARGVRGVLCGSGAPLPVEEEIVRAIRSRISENGYVHLDPPHVGSLASFKAGDHVVVEAGPLKGVKGIFDRALSDKKRVLILLEAIEYQARVSVELTDIRTAAELV
jgi:transcriptional antiterminator RfaH